MVCGVCDLSVSEDFIIEVRSKSLVYDIPMVRVCGPKCLTAYWKDYGQALIDRVSRRVRDAARQG